MVALALDSPPPASCAELTSTSASSRSASIAYSRDREFVARVADMSQPRPSRNKLWPPVLVLDHRSHPIARYAEERANSTAQPGAES